MAINKERTVPVKVSVPREVHEKLKAIAASRVMSMSQLFLQAMLDRYPEVMRTEERIAE